MINYSPSTCAKLADMQKALAHNAWSVLVTGSLDSIRYLHRMTSENNEVASIIR